MVIAAIDLGTSTTKAAVSRGVGTAEVVRFGAAPYFPSAVYVEDEYRISVGHRAVEMAQRDPSRFAPFLKQQLSRSDSGSVAHRNIPLPGKPVRLAIAVTHLLAHAYKAVEEALGASPEQVILTHPVCWGSGHKELLRQAAHSIGIKNSVTLIPEPLAVAGLHGMRRNSVKSSLGIFDLGASTFDLAILDLNAAGKPVPVFDDGITIGGDDLDAAVISLIRDDLNEINRTFFNKLLKKRPFETVKAVRQTKEKLSDQSEAQFFCSGLPVELTLTRGELEEAIQPIIEQCVSKLREALAALPEIRPVGGLLLSGGSSQVPLVRQLVADLAGEFDTTILSALDQVNPRHMVALGAIAIVQDQVPQVISETLARHSDQSRSPTSASVVRKSSSSGAPIAREVSSQLRLGVSVHRIIFIGPHGQIVGSARAGNRMAVLRGSDGPQGLAKYWSADGKSASWNRYFGVPVIDEFYYPKRGYEIQPESPIAQPVKAIGSSGIAHCGWLDGAIVALVYQNDWSALVELDDMEAAHVTRQSLPLNTPEARNEPLRFSQQHSRDHLVFE